MLCAVSPHTTSKNSISFSLSRTDVIYVIGLIFLWRCSILELMKNTEIQRVSFISDTHGLLRPEVLAALQGCIHIIHAGDVGKPEILAALRRIAPLTVVRGNVDQEAWAGLLTRDSRCPGWGTIPLHSARSSPARIGPGRRFLCGDQRSHSPGGPGMARRGALPATRAVQARIGSAGQFRWRACCSTAAGSKWR